jgi:hypothetical protein
MCREGLPCAEDDSAKSYVAKQDKLHILIKDHHIMYMYM